MSLEASDLLDFYYDELYPKLQELDIERKSVLKRVIVVSVAIGIVALVVMSLFHGSGGDGTIEISIAAFSAMAFAANWLMADYRRKFKKRIFKELIAKIDPTLLYNPSGTIPRPIFTMSGLFDIDIDYYEGNDLIKGKIGATPIEFSDLKVEKEVRDSKGRKHRSTIFAGTFIVTEFHKRFHKPVLVYPDVAENYFGLVGSWFQGALNGRLVRMDSPAFEKEFKVYSEDPVEAHYLLTPVIMEKLVALRKKADAPIYLSFRLNRLFIAIQNGGNWFEPTLFKSLLSIDVFKSYIENLNLILSIVEELNLNRRIWSKE